MAETRREERGQKQKRISENFCQRASSTSGVCTQEDQCPLSKSMISPSHFAAQGPNSLIFDSNGTLYFTDSGPMGETTIQSPKGSGESGATSGGSGRILTK